jgi:hypothetical protein
VRVYCETNFLLELAFAQEQMEQCGELLDRARHKKIELVLPSFAVFEAAEAMNKRHEERKKIDNDIQRELAALERSHLNEGLIDGYAPTSLALLQSIEDERRRLDVNRYTLSMCARSSPLTDLILTAALGAERDRKLRNRDAVIFASIRHDLETQKAEKSCFASRDKKAFLDPAIDSDLKMLGCKLFGSYADLIGYLDAAPKPMS